ncbi:hypothetical protein DEO72_LG8g1679 [Vigna unguiculata]|uniref:Uncharacterized protein n=1 Tax=Vigna unguiculata TaxID=3917 RepID=A0A4D6MS90_VIGUN|nr:hypothetical protein DEO72_LG8g1679 [Vigna unguiculata]
MVQRISDQNQYYTSTDTAPGSRARSTRRQRETTGLMVQEAPGEGKGFHQTMASETWGPGELGAWRWGLNRQAIVVVFACLRRLAPGRTCPPPGSLEAVAPSGTCPPLGDLAVCEGAGCGQYGWVQIDCPPQLLADEFGSLGILRTMFVIGNSTWRYGVLSVALVPARALSVVADRFGSKLPWGNH